MEQNIMLTQAQIILSECLKSETPSIALSLCGLEIDIEQNFSDGVTTYYFDDNSFIEDHAGELTAF